MLRLLRGTGEAEVAADFLHRVVMANYDGGENEALAAILPAIGPGEAAEFLPGFVQEHLPRRFRDVVEVLVLADMERAGGRGARGVVDPALYAAWREVLREATAAVLSGLDAAFRTESEMRPGEDDDWPPGTRPRLPAQSGRAPHDKWIDHTTVSGLVVLGLGLDEGQGGRRSHRYPDVPPGRMPGGACTTQGALADTAAYGVLWREAVDFLLERSPWYLSRREASPGAASDAGFQAVRTRSMNSVGEALWRELRRGPPPPRVPRPPRPTACRLATGPRRLSRPKLAERHGQHPLACQRKSVPTVVEEDAALEVIPAERRQARHSTARRPSRRARRLDLDAPSTCAEGHDEVNFPSILVTKVPESDVGVCPSCLCHQLLGHEGLEEVAHAVPFPDPVPWPEPGKRSGEAAVHNCRYHWRARAGLRARGSGYPPETRRRARSAGSGSCPPARKAGSVAPASRSARKSPRRRSFSASERGRRRAISMRPATDSVTMPAPSS